jgi:hypothetical protein
MKLPWGKPKDKQPGRQFVKVYKCNHCNAIFEANFIYDKNTHPPYTAICAEHKCEEQIRGLGKQVAIRYLEE